MARRAVLLHHLSAKISYAETIKIVGIYSHIDEPQPKIQVAIAIVFPAGSFIPLVHTLQMTIIGLRHFSTGAVGCDVNGMAARKPTVLVITHDLRSSDK